MYQINVNVHFACYICMILYDYDCHSVTSNLGWLAIAWGVCVQPPAGILGFSTPGGPTID